MDKISKSEQEWKQILSPEEYDITRQKGTEPPFTGKYLDSQGKQGVYQCRCCGAELFDASTKYESGSGWPSFTQPVQPENVEEVPDPSLRMQRTEVLCARCDAHLGHVFPDGPAPTGLRYCINSASLQFAGEDEGGKGQDSKG